MRPLFRWVHRFRGIAVIGVILVSGAAQAAITGKIVGRVTDANRTPLPGTAVVIEGRQLGATTDPDGQYFILQVPPGTHTVEAHLVGYQPVRQQGVVVNLDRTTRVDFVLSESAIEVEAITVTAERPIVEQDVTSSQIFISAQTAQQLPVNTLLDALALQPGIDIVNRTAISVRGSTPDEITFQVDGFEQNNALEQRSYTSMNQAMVQEVQVLTGAFTAEYSARAAVVNVVTKDPGQIPTLSLDARMIPARQQHFGPSAFADDQFDRLLYMNEGAATSGRMFNVLTFQTVGGKKIPATWTEEVNSNKPVYLADMTVGAVQPEPGPVFVGWDSLAVLANKGSYLAADPLVAVHKGSWTAAGLKEVWNWQHRGWDYAGQGDHFVDAALTIPLYGIPRTGLVLGFKDVQAQLPFPAIVQAYSDRLYEATFKSGIVPGIKLEARGRYEVVRTTVDGSRGAGGNGGSRDLRIFASGDESDIVGGSVEAGGTTLLGSVQSSFTTKNDLNKYNIAGNIPYKEAVAGAGFRFTHTLSPSTYYNVSYEYVGSNVTAHPTTPRRSITKFAADGKPLNADGTSAMDSVARSFTMGTRTVYLDESPVGHSGGSNIELDIASGYYTGGRGELSDYSEWRSDRVRTDFYTQVNANHAMKAGAEYSFQHLIKDMRGINRDNGMNGDWDRYDAKPWQAGFYLQDKMEYEGLVANLGVRLDGYQANGIILFPDKRFPDEFVRGQLVPLLMALGIDPDDYAHDELAYIDSPRSVDPSWTLMKMIESVLPHARSQAYWRFAPRMGVSHPIGVSTKFFFNFGWMYSAPKAGYRYGFNSENAQMGTSGAEIRGAPNPDLVPPRSVVYEVGFEQSLRNMYVVRVKGYSKDDEDEPGSVTRIGLGSSVISGGPGRLSVMYVTFENTQYQSYRGLELTMEKARGRFLTGSFNFDFRVITIGQSGYNQEFEDPRAINLPATVIINQPQFQPTSRLTATFHTPADWGIAAGNWSLSILQTYERGRKQVYYYGGEVTDPKVLRWVDTWRTNARLQKSILFGGNRLVTLYMDVRNLFNQKRFNPGAIVDGPSYYQGMLMQDDKNGTPQPKYKIGDSRFTSDIQRRLVRENDWLLFLDPREFQFGLRMEL